MLKTLLVVALLAVICQKAYRYYTFMGYWRTQHNAILNNEHDMTCTQKFKNILVDHEFKHQINSTVDADMLPNGLTLFLSASSHSLVDGLNNSTFNRSKNVIFLLDMNHINDEAEPIALKIFSRQVTNIINKEKTEIYNIAQ